MPKSKNTIKSPTVTTNKIRTPIVAVMGHVDHGKTSLLDTIRGTKVADKEAGGITQNTRAHEITRPNGFKITFIDTPGHEAFSNMRERGAKVTDFVMLVVAADDGIQPQTKQSIDFAKKDNVPIIVVINKIDIKGINIQKIKKELSSYGVIAEEYGGDSLFFEVSAKEKIGLENLLDGIQLLAEINELKSNQVRNETLGEAFILESSMDKLVGNVALCLLKSGDLKERYFGVTQSGYFKVRAYLDQDQKNINIVKESQPFWITGLKMTLPAGEIIYFTEDEEKAIKFHNKLKIKEIIKPVETVTEAEQSDVESLFTQMLVKREEIKQGIEQKQLNVIVKTSTEGTLEAILEKLKELKNEFAHINILTSGTGNVNEDEINRAKLAKAIIVTFQIPTPKKILEMAKKEKVLVRNYEIVYELFQEVEEVLESLENPIEEEVEVARAKVKQVFTLSNKNTVIGSEVTKGIILKGYRIKIERSVKGQLQEIGRGKITSLKIRKDEVKEVKKGLDCGIVTEPNIEGIEENDELIAFKVEKY